MTTEQFNTAEFIEDAEQHIMHVYNRYPIVLDHGKGSRLYDKEGNEYLDFVAGISVNALGYADPGINQAIADQCAKLMHVSNLYWTEPLAEAARRLTEATGMDQVFFGNSGAEAVEAALKLARISAKLHKSPEATEIISMNDSFHGRTYAAITVTGQEHYHENLQPMLPDVKYADFNDYDGLEALVSPKTCAILLEPVQGEGGIVPADPEYLKKVRDLCDRENIILIFDEVQCGAGRTGKFLAAHNYGVKGDIVCMAKGIGAGFPIGACLATEEIAKDFTPGTHGSTFGGNALACAVSAYVLSRTATPEFLKSVEDKGNRLMDGLRDLQKEFPELVEDVRGLGLICGLQITVPTGEFVNRAMDNGLLLVAAQKNTIRFVPALTVENEEIDEAVAILRKVLQSFAV